MGKLLPFTPETLPGVKDLSGNGGGGSMEARVARLEASVGHIQTDISDIKQDLRNFRASVDQKFLWLLGAYGVGFFSLLGFLAKGFKWV
jgi:hypothetical protein